MKWKAGDVVYVSVNDKYWETDLNGIYTISSILEDNLDSDGKTYPINIEELPIHLEESEVRELTKLEKALK